MNITSAQYVTDIEGETSMIKVVTDDDTLWVPNNFSSNRHYQAIQDWVAEGNTIQEAD